VHEVAEHLKAVSLLNWLFLKKFGNGSNSSPELLQLCVLVSQEQLIVLDLEIQLGVDLFQLVDLAQKLFPLTHQLLVTIFKACCAVLAIPQHFNFLFHGSMFRLQLGDGIVLGPKVCCIVQLVLKAANLVLKLGNLV